MAFDKQSIIWNKFYGGMGSDDQLVGASQILYSENLDLKSNSRFAQLNKKPIQKVTTGSDIILGFVNAVATNGDKRTFGYGQDGVVYYVDGTDDTPTYLIDGGADDIVNAINFYNKVYFIPAQSTTANVELWGDFSSDVYGLSATIALLKTTSSKGTSDDTYPMYNYLDSFLYIGIGKDVYRLDNAGVSKTFNLGTDDIVAITQLGGVFRLYQKDGRILFWDGLNDAIDSSTSVNDTIRTVVQHGGIDYIVGGVSQFFTNFYVLNGYRADLLQKTITTEATNLDKIKFGIINRFKNIISFDGQIYFGIEDAGVGGIYSFGSKKPQFPLGYEYLLNLSPDDTTLDIFSLGNGEDSGSFYFGYDDGPKTAIAEFNPTITGTYQGTGKIYTPVFNAGAMTILKGIEEIVVYIDIPTGTSATLKTSINGGSYTDTVTLKDGRNKINTLKKEFFDIVFEVVLNSNTAKTATPRFHDIKLLYTVKDKQ